MDYLLLSVETTLLCGVLYRLDLPLGLHTFDTSRYPYHGTSGSLSYADVKVQVQIATSTSLDTLLLRCIILMAADAEEGKLHGKEGFLPRHKPLLQ